MKRLSVLVLALFASLALADTPVGPMNYQGRLLDNGIPVGYPTPTTVNFTVKIYDAASGGTLKYQETHSNVSVDDGVYSFLVGTQTKQAGDSTWSVELWNCCANLFMEITANGDVLTPRSRLAAAPYAFQANLALTTNNALALGGKSATEYDNTLATICVAGKGKWLELVGKCLGIGSSFPGPTRVNWNTLTANSNFKNLDLSNADISGINFGSPSAANLTGTTLKGTTYSVAGISGANLTGTLWDGAIATDSSAFSVSSSTNVTNATMKNMDLSKWNMSLITSFLNIDQFSAGFLSACPAAPLGFTTSGMVWECRLMHSTGSTYFMIGPYVNLSSNSASTMTSYGSIVLDLDRDALDSAGITNASFVGVTVMQDFTNANISYADFSYARLANISLAPSTMSGADFTNSTWDNVVIQGSTVSAMDFTNARLNHVRFDVNSNNNNYSYAVLKAVDFNAGLQRPNFTGAVLEDVQISTLYTLPVTFDGTRIYGNFHIAAINATAAPSMTFKDIVFSNATVSGALTDTNFTNSITIKNTVFKNLDLCSTAFPLSTGAPHTELSGVRWEGLVECPDGTDVTGSSTNYSGTCNYLTRMTPMSGTTGCTPGLPGALQ